ncbi:DNA repair protein RecN [Oxobacter pfennigii]|uniref:DNA repair protein RecN n=1 Tax=Oxobacter pfennigii TaxID=36849 RepID=A0A0P8W888_9CLOT|nr:DNA repair protein RecN [Oxobacter pfennigii]KPU44902.1 DNA repair protein RecN [Oxobacter pfennigii]
MLLNLHIKDFALIEDLKLEFSKGLNILTGETGAGKSIIIDSVNFILGDRASKEIIRHGYEKTYVEGIFEFISNSPLKNIMEENGIDIDEDIIILSRELNVSGKSICRINGKMVTTSVLKSIGSHLIDIHGQHEHQSLLKEENHMELLDMFGSQRLHILKDEVHVVYSNVQDIKRELQSIMGDDRERQQRLDLLNYQLKEIDESKLKTGEEEDLNKQKTLLLNSGKLFSVLNDSYNNLYESEEQPSVFDRLGKTLSEFKSIMNLDEKLSEIHKSLEDSYYGLEGAINDIRGYREKIDFDPELIDQVEYRLDTINKLKRKYGSTIEDILKYREKIYIEIDNIQNSEERISSLKARLDSENKILFNISAGLSEERHAAARRMEKGIEDELKFLGMDKSRFVVNFEIIKKDGQIVCNDKGVDIITFLISTNIGEPEKSLSKIASGGELSRIMLAVKTVLAYTDKIPSLIFDEIDTGISGKAAQAVGEKLRQLSGSHQIICVTHLPQIASMADTHFYISKASDGNKTNTSVKILNHKEKINEIARMLVGAKITALTLQHAEEMLIMSQKIKKAN